MSHLLAQHHLTFRLQKSRISFYEIECLLFINQKLMPNEEIKMPVSFYIDPEIDNDDNLNP